jgi:hypothetical protein
MAKSKQKKHSFEDDPPHQDKFPQERADVETMSTGIPLGRVGLQYRYHSEGGTDEREGELDVPQRLRGSGEFITHSRTIGVKLHQK